MALSVALGCGACGGDSSKPGGTSGSSSQMDMQGACSTEQRAEPFSAGMSKTGTAGVTVSLESSDPAPPVVGDNAWTLRVHDAAGPVAGATISVVPFMVDHGHGALAPTVTDQGGGNYRAAPVTFTMPGYWEVTIGVVTAAGVSDQVMFPLCVE